jgi:hypothetical protein
MANTTTRRVSSPHRTLSILSDCRVTPVTPVTLVTLVAGAGRCGILEHWLVAPVAKINE